MSKPLPYEQEIQSLRLAAERGDVNGCWDATQKLLRWLPAQRALRLVRDFLARRLLVFERHQPGVLWPREFIESVTGTSAALDGKTWPKAEDDFPGPGANSFINAVEALWKASVPTEDVRRSELLADALERAVSAERLEYWGALHPDKWARWYQLAVSGSDDMSQYHTLLAIKRDPGTASVERAAWLEAAQQLEEALGGSAREPH
ncbi:hypothetical protein [Hyalangium sp.]|uniref:hypothetical protein n=1 Tax=Hyalangium sp. TaxID=2028555 RepID=UPI002D5CDFA3|nr:hypothetical protein [Hyalangium sp.]HYH94630.1 hypothetical protein [Hyalangium sp.]